MRLEADYGAISEDEEGIGSAGAAYSTAEAFAFLEAVAKRQISAGNCNRRTSGS